MIDTPIIDPLKFIRKGWPHVELYKEQVEVLYSVRDNEETYVPAGNQLGKDFISAYCALWFFCSRRPARVVTTSVQYNQLNDVLWGEIRRALDTCKINLPLRYNHMHIRQVDRNGKDVPLCELVGQCVNKGESLLGRHLPSDIPRTLAIFDEASGIDNSVYESADTWAHRKLVIGNPYPCSNFFFQGVTKGDLKNEEENNYHRKVIRIRALDSPNVRLAQAEIENKKKPSHKTLVPGVVSWRKYCSRRKLWDKIRQCIGLDAEFYLGAETLVCPPEWLNRAEEIASRNRDHKGKHTLGVDSAQGGDNTAFAVSSMQGLRYLESLKTPDTSVITGKTVALMQRFRIKPKDVLFDAGGGGKQHVDRLRKNGYNVRLIAFGGSATPRKKRGLTTIEQRERDEETKYVYKNRRAELYGCLRIVLDPDEDYEFGIPAEEDYLRRQLAPIPLLYDEEGRMWLPPKTKRNKDSTVETLIDIIGHSPDEADALALSVFGLLVPSRRATAGAII